MRKFLTAAFISAILASAPAVAQQQVTFTVTVPEAQAMINAVGQHSWNDVNPLMQKLMAQAQAQLAPPLAPAPPTPPAPPAAIPAPVPPN
jgi:hypothetical protein